MKIIIRKNSHRPFPYFALRMPVCTRKITLSTRRFMFTKSCLYDLKDEDQYDVNKLFGFSIGFHHTTSFRFGWRADLKTNTIEIVAYEYHDTIRQETMHVCNVEIDKWHEFALYYFPDVQKTWYLVDNFPILSNYFKLKKNSGLGYRLGLYFGGNEKAPQDILIYRK
jgi:hypothetical protein